MAAPGVAALLGVLREAELLAPAQFDELSRKLALDKVCALLDELRRRQWLTSFPIKHFAEGHEFRKIET
jgi:hypothetical protein